MKTLMMGMVLFLASTFANATLISESYVGQFDELNARLYLSFDITQDNSLFEVQSLGFLGGINAEGTVIDAGGFHNYSFLFDSNSNLLAQDYGYGTTLSQVLNTGSYVFAFTQQDNFLLSGDVFTGNWVGTGWPDWQGQTQSYAFDLQGQNIANLTISGFGFTPVSTAVSEPATLALFGLSIFGLVARKRIKQ